MISVLERFVRPLPLLLGTFLLFAIPRTGGAAWAPVALTDSIGSEVDSLERSAYGFFPDLENFESARTLTNGSGYRIEVTTGAGTERRTRTTKLSRDAWESTRLHARAVERYRALSAGATGHEADLEYLLALRFAAASRYDVARALLDDLATRSAGTPLEGEVEQTRNDIERIKGQSRALFQPMATHDQSGRTDLLVFSGFYGLWLGIATPIAFESESPQAYAAGFLVAPTASLLIASNASRETEMGIGRAHMISLGGWLGTWQGAGWAAVSDADGNTAIGIGVVSGLAGIATSTLLTSKVHFSEGHGALTNNALLWGAWFGLVGGIVGGAEDDALLRASLVGTDALVLTTAIAARDVHMSKNRARVISLLGIVGTAAGFGVDLLAEVDEAEGVFAIAGMGSVAGLVIGTSVTKNYDDGKDLSCAPALQKDNRWSLAPSAKIVRDPDSGRHLPAIGVRLSF